MSEEKTRPACVNCVHFYRDDGLVRCWHPDVTTFDSVTGEEHPRARDIRRDGPCGVGGIMFEAREDHVSWPVVFLFIGIFAAGVLAGVRELVHIIFGVWIP